MYTRAMDLVKRVSRLPEGAIFHDKLQISQIRSFLENNQTRFHTVAATGFGVAVIDNETHKRCLDASWILSLALSKRFDIEIGGDNYPHIEVRYFVHRITSECPPVHAAIKLVFSPNEAWLIDGTAG